MGRIQSDGTYTYTYTYDKLGQLINLGVQSIRRTSNAIVHGGIKEGVRTAAKAVAYYVKNTKSYYSGVVKGLLKDAIVSLGSAFITSKIGKKYIRTAIN